MRAPTAVGEGKALGEQAPAQQLADRRGPARHAAGESKVVDRLELVGIEHDLHAFAAGQIVAFCGLFGHGSGSTYDMRRRAPRGRCWPTAPRGGCAISPPRARISPARFSRPRPTPTPVP